MYAEPRDGGSMPSCSFAGAVARKELPRLLPVPPTMIYGSGITAAPVIAYCIEICDSGMPTVIVQNAAWARST